MNVESWLIFLRRLGITLEQNDTVALEGAPIYLSDEPGPDNHNANAVVQSVATELRDCCRGVQLHVLFDDLNGEERDGVRQRYRDLFPFPPHRVALETELIPDAWQVFEAIPTRWTDGVAGLRRLTRNGEDVTPALLKGDGVPTCALLDTAFQLGKAADLIVVVHPEKLSVDGSSVDFRIQQQGVHAVLRAMRSVEQSHDALPWKHGYINIWLDAAGNVINVTRLHNKGRSVVMRGVRMKEQAAG